MTALDLPVGLHRQAQPAAVLVLGSEDKHPGHTEHHCCRRAALSQSISSRPLESVAWSLLIFEGLGPSPRQPGTTGLHVNMLGSEEPR